ncbi:O-sialoglycoprotein endopeptidase [Tepidibacillus sp. HK-1]|uniref:Kae1-like domain-containing protein n=1 Tax=Tepidibacillus sp. HK-1 TaxID=1883407 RepID=UPI000853CE10|nr:O-sialoglycoprotein endopeptidase [Tepidibacillus sp. HK-1]GBF11039.1 tRNA N6-adenosine threonylcarbamoyltransferase [Tepidibacillus sp. HK-1]
MRKKSFLGIDTSNYMTSICFIDKNREVLYEAKKLLQVGHGKRGLQQSEALFQHVRNLPELFKNWHGTEEFELSGIAVSRAPRPDKDSYMPVFLAGLSVAESMSATFHVPIYFTTHQEGHIAAGLYSAEKRPKNKHFLTVHLSGGTSEILFVDQMDSGFQIIKLGGTLDLHAGQLIDRIGVLLGFSFPAGRFVEELALSSHTEFKRIPSSIKELSFHFSGAENEAMKRIKNGEPKEEVARAIEHNIATTISKVLRKAIEQGYPKEILIVGGVAQNQYIREYLIKRLEHRSVGAALFFAKKEYSGDNAFGVANIGLNQWNV